MMIERSGTDLKAQRGDRLTAEMWNRMARNVESLNDTAIGMQTGAGIKAPASGLILRAENVGDSALEPFHVATIKGQAYGNPIGQRDTVLQIGVADDCLAAWGIVLDTIEPETVGRVLVLGVGWLEYNRATSGAFASTTPGKRVAALGDTGAAEVIETLPEEGLALVRLPAGASAQSGNSVILVRNHYYERIPRGGVFRYEPVNGEFLPEEKPISKSMSTGEDGTLSIMAGQFENHPTAGRTRLAVALQDIGSGATGYATVDGVIDLLYIPSTIAFDQVPTNTIETFELTAPLRVGWRMAPAWHFNFHVTPFDAGRFLVIGPGSFPHLKAQFCDRNFY